MPLQIIRQDLSQMKVDAIVNTTNQDMVGYSGSDLAIHQAAGIQMDEECKKNGPLEPGTTVITKGYKLPCKYVIHTIGPVWNGGKEHEEDQLRNCYISCLQIALSKHCKTIAFPLISSGYRGFPKDIVLSLAVSIITEFLHDYEMMVYLCVYDKQSYELSCKLFAGVQAFINDNYVENKDESISADNKKALSIKSQAGTSNATIGQVLLESNGSTHPIKQPYGLEHQIQNRGQSFAELLFELIDARGKTDVEIYKKANISRKTFSKIRCDKNYRPSKETMFALAIALELSIKETNNFLSSAGFALSRYYLTDVIIEYYISHSIYNMDEINQALFDNDQPCLCC